MDFNDTPEEAAFRTEARAWLQANGDAISADDDDDGDLLGEKLNPEIVATCKAWQKKKADAGWACLTWPKEFGGRAATPIENVIWKQEESKVKTPPDIYGIGLGMCGPTIMTHGNDAQKARWIPDMMIGQEVWCQLFSEPGAGSDLAGLRSTAVRDGDDWIINGQKIWTTGAQISDWGILVVRSDPNAAKHAGLTYFVVDMKAPGVEVRPITQINGGHGFNEVFFTDVRIPDENRIGEVGDGWRVAITTLMNERASIGGGGGSGNAADLIRIAREVEIDGRPAIEDRSVRQKLARFYIRGKGLQFTGNRTLTALSRGQTPGPESSLGKLIGGVLVQDMSEFGIELEGMAGMLNDSQYSPDKGAWQDRFLAIPGLRIAGGTDEVLRNIIAERVLGLPPEVRLDKGVAFKDIPTGPPSK